MPKYDGQAKQNFAHIKKTANMTTHRVILMASSYFIEMIIKMDNTNANKAPKMLNFSGTTKLPTLTSSFKTRRAKCNSATTKKINPAVSNAIRSICSSFA
jgi:hypothetical protein